MSCRAIGQSRRGEIIFNRASAAKDELLDAPVTMGRLEFVMDILNHLHSSKLCHVEGCVYCTTFFWMPAEPVRLTDCLRWMLLRKNDWTEGVLECVVFSSGIIATGLKLSELIYNFKNHPYDTSWSFDVQQDPSILNNRKWFEDCHQRCQCGVTSLSCFSMINHDEWIQDVGGIAWLGRFKTQKNKKAMQCYQVTKWRIRTFGHGSDTTPRTTLVRVTILKVLFKVSSAWIEFTEYMGIEGYLATFSNLEA